MANAIYPKAREAFLKGDLDWLVQDFKVVAVDVGYVYSSAHDFLNDVGAGTRVATSGNLASKTATNGYADAADVTLSTVTGDTITGLVIYRDSGVEGTSELIVFLDTKSDASLISLAPDGGDVTIRWAAAGIFRL